MIFRLFHAKGQLISKAIYGLLTSPKQRTDEFVLFAFLLFTANKSNSSVHFLGESTARQSAFRFYCTFSIGINIDKNVLFAFKLQHNQPKNPKQFLGNERYSFCIIRETKYSSKGGWASQKTNTNCGL